MVFAKIKRGKYRFDGAAFQVRWPFCWIPEIRSCYTQVVSPSHPTTDNTE